MRKTALRSGVGLALLIFMTLEGNAQVSDLVLDKSGNNVELQWTTGTTPHRVLRSLSPVFMSGNVSVASGVTTGGATDAGALVELESYFYQVLDSDDTNPPLYDLNTPRPVPMITMLTPATGSAGTSVTIDGSNFADLGSGQTVMFGAVAADVVSSSETQIVATAPTGTVTDDVVVCVADQCSNGVRFTVTVGPAFQDISSLAFEPGTGSLWLGDRGTADDVIEIDSSGTVSIRANLGEAFISNPSPGDGNGRIYYSNGTVSNFNQGTINYLDSSDNSTTFFRAAGQGGGVDPVHARGMAARDDEADVIYFLDGNNNTVRRVPEFGLIDFNWGNTALSFNNPAGGRFDSDGNLYVSSTTSIFKIAPDETTTVLTTEFTGAAGIDLSEVSGIPTLLVADKATGEVYLVNGEDGSRTLVDSGFTNPVAVAFSEDLATGDLFYDVAEPTRIIRLPDPVIKFAIKKKKNTPVLINKHRSDDAYPSSFQTQPREIRVEATVIDGGPAAGVDVFFRLIDPKDTAPYASTGSGDNKGGLGTIDCGSGPATTCMATSDAAGKVSLMLTVTDTFAGDNYRIEASLTQTPFKVKAKSAAFTAWKRAYVEYDRMYKVGEFVDQPSGPGHPVGMPDPTKVFVVNPGTFTAGDQVHVLSATSAATVIGEMHTVASVATDHLVLNAALANVYDDSGGNPPADVFPYAFVARVAGGAHEITPTPQALAKAFDDPFTEWRFVDGGSFLPSWPVIAEIDIDPRTFWFFKNFDRPSVTPTINHVQLVAAGALAAPDAMGVGRTASERNWSWILTDTIVSSCGGGCTSTDLQNYKDSVIVHECAHQWDVNPPVMTTDGHDTLKAWNDSMRGCLMNALIDNPTAGVPRFHNDLGASIPNDLYCIRGHVDDLNQETCTW
ncbi:MAG: hypothetical protein GY716_23375 [bacterium]|nr:hypothetical protein [bacterium]